MHASKWFRFLKILTAAGLFLGATTPLWGFVAVLNTEGQRLHWELLKPSQFVHTNVVNPITKAVRYHIAADAYSTTNTLNELNGVRASFAQWQSVPGTHLKFEDAGLVAPGPGVDINTKDNTNLVFWVKNGTLINGGLDDMRGALGLSYQDYYDDNTLGEADIVLNGNPVVNGSKNSWFTDFNATTSSERFVEGVMLHEIGHFIGLNHSPAGASTMMVRGTAGVGTQAGLSRDEMAAVTWIYPTPNPNLATLSGVVTMAGKGVFGASVVAEDSSGNLVQATVTRQDGSYEIPQLVPGSYKLRVCPLDPRGVKSSIMSGLDIDPFGTYAETETGFLPSLEVVVAVPPAGTQKQNFNVTPAGNTKVLRITRIRPPHESANTFFGVNTAASVQPGRRQVYVGVYGPDLPTSGATLIVTGDGITHGPVIFLQEAFVGLNLVSVKIDISEDATPGMRSFVLRFGDQVAYANGFLEILPPWPDWNFDGVDDIFQRKYFHPFTTLAGGPDLDPDADGFTTLQESQVGTNPLDGTSVFEIESVSQTAKGTTLRWQAAAGHKYRVLSKHNLEEAVWEKRGEVLGATGGVLTEFLDTTQAEHHRFYRVVGGP